MNEWRKTKLKINVDPEMFRFRISDSGPKKEMALAWLVNVEGIEIFVPKSQCNIGIEPGGKYYALDIPKWMAEKKGLI